MAIGTSDGEAYESDFDFAFGQFTQGPGNKSTTKQEDVSTTGQSPSPDNQSDIDNLVAAAGVIGAGDPIIGQMEATAQRSNPSSLPSVIANAENPIGTLSKKQLNTPALPYPKSDELLEGQYDYSSQEYRNKRELITNPSPREVIRPENLPEDLMNVRGNRDLAWLPKKASFQQESSPTSNPTHTDPIASWGQYAMMKMKDIPSNPGVEAEKIAGGTAWARGQPRLEVKSMSEYYDKVPSDVRMKGNGISHPGFRFQVQDKEGNPVGKAYTNSRRAAGQVDKLDNDYGGYKYRKVMVPATDITDKEFEQMKKLGLIKPDAER